MIISNVEVKRALVKKNPPMVANHFSSGEARKSVKKVVVTSRA